MMLFFCLDSNVQKKGICTRLLLISGLMGLHITSSVVFFLYRGNEIKATNCEMPQCSIQLQKKVVAPSSKTIWLIWWDFQNEWQSRKWRILSQTLILYRFFLLNPVFQQLFVIVFNRIRFSQEIFWPLKRSIDMKLIMNMIFISISILSSFSSINLEPQKRGSTEI